MPRVYRSAESSPIANTVGALTVGGPKDRESPG